MLLIQKATPRDQKAAIRFFKKAWGPFHVSRSSVITVN
ncbi:hypothetical protein MC28_E049 (plasmid) [Bacillus thuringiensis MC28]|nr:hypothetical protein MC28_E049 [Bacillus thuringiensis MC28]